MARTDDQSAPDFSYALEFEELGDALSQATGFDRANQLEHLVSEISRNCPDETAERLTQFSDAYFRPSPSEYRRRILHNRRDWDMMTAVADPIYAVLQYPDPLPAANWLRKVILTKDIPKLRQLIRALDKLRETNLHVGMDFASLAHVLHDAPAQFTATLPAYRMFQKMFRDTARLPTKKELRLAIDTENKSKLGQNAREIDQNNWTDYLLWLGLNGLPEDRGRERAI